MSEVINGVPRELLERVSRDVTGREHWDALEPDAIAARQEIRALLTAQPQARPCTKPDCFPFCDCGGVDDAPQSGAAHRPMGRIVARVKIEPGASAAITPGAEGEVRIIFGDSQPQASAAQSAPAGEREAFKQALHSQTAFKLTTDRIEAAEWGAAWQRTQSAGVPEGWRKLLEDFEAIERSPASPIRSKALHALAENVRAMLAAAPAQPAAQELCRVCKGLGRYQDGDSGTDADGRAPNIVDCDCADSERLPQYRAAQDQGEVQRLREALDCDRAYRNGLQAGYSFGASGDEESYQRSMAAYGKEILAASTGQEVKP